MKPFLQFICEVCGLIYDEAKGDPDSGLPPGTRFADIPEDWACPICGVGKADFKPWTPPSPAPASAAAATSATAGARGRHHAPIDAGVLIVGAGRAGWAVVEALRDHDATLPITLLSACSGDRYDKPQLSVAVARGLRVDAMVRETAQAAAQRLRVRLLCQAHAVHVDAAARTVRSTRGTLRWRQLVLAHGAEAQLPAALPARHVWRVNDLAAYARLRAALDGSGMPQRVAIVGAGLIGCELANDLALAGHCITLIDVQARPLAAQLPPEASARLLAAWQGLSIRFIGGARVLDVAPAPGPAPLTVSHASPTKSSALPLRLQLLDGQTFYADHVIAATGLRAADRLPRSAGLHFDAAAGGISVDASTGATTCAGIYALGDCAVVHGRASRFIEPIAGQARGIAAAILGLPVNADAALSSMPVLRVKTSALPITLTWLDTDATLPAGDGWQVERDDEQALSMQRVDASGRVLARLSAARAG